MGKIICWDLLPKKPPTKICRWSLGFNFANDQRKWECLNSSAILLMDASYSTGIITDNKRHQLMEELHSKHPFH